MTEMDRTKILQILNDYLHLMGKHDDIDQFEYITNQLENCAMNECKILAPDKRNRNELHDSIAYYDIMDKIHCYYHHSYDSGYRLSIEDKENIYKSHHDEKENVYLLNSKLSHMVKAIMSKRKIFDNITNSLNNRQPKYNQLFTDENIDTKQNHEDSYKIYSYGYGFYYGYERESRQKLSIDVSKTAYYSTLKEELTQNDIAILPKKAFDNEYRKAGIHFESYYNKKKRYITYMQQMSLVQILSLMIYSNYTELQCHFSKTYRECNGKRHVKFYHLGKYIKMSMELSGTSVYFGNVHNFYHGVGQILVFPNYFCNFDSTQGISVQCPLSTSSVFEVAVNFTNNNNGIVIQFGSINSSAQYLSLGWLSDYPAEAEHLFIQMGEFKLNINNMFEVKAGIEYERVLRALKMMDAITRYHEVIYIDSICNLMDAIIRNQLSYTLSQYDPFCLSEYGERMCNVYFRNKKQ
eukprot:130789_1